MEKNMEHEMEALGPFKGVGLGLNMSYSLKSLNGGHIGFRVSDLGLTV